MRTKQPGRPADGPQAPRSALGSTQGKSEPVPPAASRPAPLFSGHQHLPASAWLWKNEQLSDAVLQLRTDVTVVADQLAGDVVTVLEPSADDCADEHGRPKVARRETAGCQAAEAACAQRQTKSFEEGGRSFFVHGAVLATASQYFRARLLLAMQGGSGAGAATPSSGQRRLIVEYVEERELDAMEAVMRFCYTGQLAEDCSDASQISVDVLVQMLVLADRFDIPSCASLCGQVLIHKSCAPQVDILAINAALSVPASMLGHALQPVESRLLKLFGDVESVCDDLYHCEMPQRSQERPGGAGVATAGGVGATPTAHCATATATAAQPAGSNKGCLGRQLLQLSHAALMVLLQSDDLEVFSENSVLMMADAWVCGHCDNNAVRDTLTELPSTSEQVDSGGSSDGSACTAQQLCDISNALRLIELDSTFLSDVVPQLEWLQVRAADLLALLRFSAAPGALRQAYTRNGAALGLAGWYRGGQRVVLAFPLRVQIVIKKADLVALLERALAKHERRTLLDMTREQMEPTFLNGYTITLTLAVEDSSDGGSGKEVVVGHHVEVWRGDLDTEQVADMGGAMTAKFTAKSSDGYSKTLKAANNDV